MTRKDDDSVKDTVLGAFEVALDAQLKAIRRLRTGEKQEKPSRKGRSHIGMVEDILATADRPLHITEVISRVQERYGVALDRESIVSSLTKKIRRDPRFVRTGRNTFAIQGGK